MGRRISRIDRWLDAETVGEQFFLGCACTLGEL